MNMKKVIVALVGFFLIAGAAQAASTNLNLSPVKGAPAAGNKLQVYQRSIDFSGTKGLLTNTYFRVFDLDAGDVVVGGMVSVVSTNTATNSPLAATDFSLGVSGGDTILDRGDLTAVAVIGAGSGTNALSSAPIGDDYVTVIGNGMISNAVLDITLLVLKAGDTSGN